jgi:hypothetical protein
MTTTYLRFPDEATGMAALQVAGFTATDEDDNTVVITASHTHALDLIGPISIGGEYDPETGEVITPPTPLYGWHVNYVGDLPEEWEDYIVTPEHPSRVFATAPQPETKTTADGTVLVRARDSFGQFVGDDPTTLDIDEAWVEAP